MIRVNRIVWVLALVACGDDGNVDPLPDAPPPNIPPQVTITARNFQSVVGRAITLRAEGEDPDGDELTFEWIQTAGPTVTLLDPTSANPSYIARSVGVYKFTVTASDGLRTTPPIEVKVDVYDIDGGEDHTLALKPDGTLLSWGDNFRGQLGDPSVNDDVSRLRPFVGPVCEPDSKECIPFANVVAIATGREHSLALKADGTVWAWGDHGEGQLGVGDQKISGSDVPMQVCNVGATDCEKDPLTDVVAIAAGFVFSAALKSDGTVVTWGNNDFGELGDGQFSDAFTPVRVCAVGQLQTSAVAAFGGTLPCTEFLDGVVQLTAGGGGHAIAILEDGSVVAWGHNKAGQVGIGDLTEIEVRVPKPVCAAGATTPCTEFLTDIVAVDAWSGHSLALTSAGSLLAWGSNDDAELGAVTNGKCITGNCSVVPVPVCLTDDSPCTTPFTGVASFAAGRRFSVAITGEGNVFSWGDNALNQLGDGTSDLRASPGRVCAFAAATPCTEFLEGIDVIAAGSFHAIVLDRDGLLFAWGDNENGQIGNNDPLVNPNVPAVVGGF